MQTKWKFFIGILPIVLLFILSMVSVALADPENNPNVFTATLECGEEAVLLTFVVLPSGSPTLQDVDSTGGFRLTQVDFTIVAGPDSGVTGTVPYGAGNGQSRGLQDDLITCYVTEVRDGNTFEFELTGFFVPRKS